MLNAVSRFGRGVRLFHRGKEPGPGEGRYASLTSLGLTQSLADQRLEADGMVQFALALSLVGWGETVG